LGGPLQFSFHDLKIEIINQRKKDLDPIFVEI